MVPSDGAQRADRRRDRAAPGATDSEAVRSANPRRVRLGQPALARLAAAGIR